MDLTARDVIASAQKLYAASNGTPPSHRHRQIRDLTKNSCLRLIAEGRPNEAFAIFSAISIPATLIDDEFFELRNLLLLHEHNRVARVKRFLKVTLICVLTYLLLIAPTIFVALENPYRTAHQMERVDWSEGLYWSILTSTTVGYGDIVPQTPYARLLSLFDAVLGVTLMGVTAGLILAWVTPRRLD